jgi:gas vesicle protein
MSKSGRAIAIGALLAAGIGYVTGILTAPKSGKETRKDIKDAADKTIVEAEKNLKTAHTELNNLLGSAREHATTAKGRAKEEIHSATSIAEQAKEKIRIALSSIHEGESTDKELNKAISDAEKSIEHLKNFLKK